MRARGALERILLLNSVGASEVIREGECGKQGASQSTHPPDHMQGTHPLNPELTRSSDSRTRGITPSLLDITGQIVAAAMRRWCAAHGWHPRST
jgi:hypothetical protein